MPILDARTVEVFSHSPEQTRRIGMRLGALLQPGDLVCLQGELGAGKTTLVQGAARGWGSLDAVSSPTFVLVNVYRRPEGSELFHLDAYRLDSALEAEELDIDGMLARGALIVEWPERVRSALPEENLWADFDAPERAPQEYGDLREMRFKAQGTRYETILSALRREVYGGD